MIKIYSYGLSPSWYQIDQSYNLPSVTGAVQWNGNTKCFEVSNGASWQRIDNTVQISNTYDMHTIALWAMKKMQEEEETKKLRSKYPALDEAYNHLELIKTLVSTGPEENSVQTSP